MKLKKGTRVLLKRGSRYTPCESNPTEGSRYECVGTIAMKGVGHYRVNWDNGTTNGYVDDDLRPDSPCIDLWQEI